MLRTAAGEGRIGHDELDERLSRALSAKTYRELHATVDDIPRDRGGSNRRRHRRNGRSPAGRSRRSATNPGCWCSMVPVLVITLTLAAIGMMVWFVFIVAVLALGHTRSGVTCSADRARPDGPRARLRSGIAGSGWRWI